MHPRRRRAILANLAAGALLAAYGGSLLAGSLPARAETNEKVSPGRAGPVPLCSETPGDFCVVDGDTIHWQGAVVRLLDIDAPENFDSIAKANWRWDGGQRSDCASSWPKDRSN